MAFWKPIALLLQVRFRTARAGLAVNPTGALWTGIFLVLLLLAALSMGGRVAAHWVDPKAQNVEASLGRLWLEMQAFWLLALLFPGGIALLGQIPPRSTLLPFPLRTLQIFAAEVSAVLLDVPLLLACALTLPVLGFLLGAGHWLQAIIVVASFLFLGLQTGLCARLLAYLGTLGARRLRRLAAIPGMTAFLFLCLCAGVPPAFASLTSTATQHFLPRHLSLAVKLPAADLSRMLPSHLAAHAVFAARQEDSQGMLGSLGSMAACLILTGGATLQALRRVEKLGFAGEGRASTASKARPSRPIARTPFAPSRQIAALVGTEWRLLLRTPQNYLPLRKPASLLLLGVFVFLSPDMGKNPIANLEELLAIGTLLYSILWQMQLLCNRFGNEAGTGALLFGFSLPRRRLLLGKNIALFGLLLLVDGPILGCMAYISEVPERVGLFLLWLPMILLTLTSLGNVATALQPFTILRRERQGSAEPPDTLAWAYLFVGGVAVALLMIVGELFARGLPGRIGAAALLSALYIASLFGASALLTRQEHRMIAATSQFA